MDAASRERAVVKPPPLPRAPVPKSSPKAASSGRDQKLQTFSHYVSRSLLRAGPIVFAAVVIAILVYAWIVRDEGHWTAEHGIGYWLGIFGSVAMLVLILYPLRKRFRILHGLGRVASWFRIHMILGILGPLLIVLHCNFKIGSLNSRLALFTMLTVVASEIVGRYLYSQVHKGLYGSRAEAREIMEDVEAMREQIGFELPNDASLFSALEAFGASALRPQTSAFAAGWAALTIGGRVRRCRRKMMRAADKAISAHARESGWSWRQRRDSLQQLNVHLRTYFAAIKKAHKLAVFDQLFALWHVLHMPLFVLLAITVVIHIVAVHLY